VRLVAAAGDRGTDTFGVRGRGHRRLFNGKRAPETDDTPVKLIVGRPDFRREGPDVKGDVQTSGGRKRLNRASRNAFS
jgi:hypothetical protein